MEADAEPPNETTLRPAGRKIPAQDNQSLFIEAMADPARRRIAFDLVERNCRMRFRVGEAGIKVYLELLKHVQSSNVPEAVFEFERRFVPMLDRRALKKMIENDRMTPP
jgi:hypothetical protein